MKVALFTLDVELDFGSENYGIELINNYELFQRFSGMLNSRSIPLNGFIVTEMLTESKHLIHRLQNELPAEFGSHSHRHTISSRISEADLAASVDAFITHMGKAPSGYRAPCGLIDEKGIEVLIKYGFVYDSSIFPSLRGDEYRYNNTSLPQTPFIYKGRTGELLEFPIGCINTIRLVLSVSYLKLFGLKTYLTMMRFLGLPDIVIINSHPYDFTISDCIDRIPGWKRLAHGRNAANAFRFTECMLDFLLDQGYQFISYSLLVEQAKAMELPIYRI
jgi:hypothetical protein